MKPCVEALAAGMEDGGKLPVEGFPEPSDEGKGGMKVDAEFFLGAGAGAVEPVEIEDGEWG